MSGFVVKVVLLLGGQGHALALEFVMGFAVRFAVSCQRQPRARAATRLLLAQTAARLLLAQTSCLAALFERTDAGV